MTTRAALGIALSVVLVLSTSVGAPAFAASKRTFVSAKGDDSNSCGVDAPCRTFGAALLQTLAKGEIIVVDSAGYGPVVITKPVSIIAPQGVYAGITVSGGTGITVNPGSGEVTLRNLNLTGLGGVDGIDFQSGDSLNIEGVVIGGFTNAGIKAQRNSSARILIKDTISRDNGAYGATIGTLAGTMDASVVRSRFDSNQFSGLFFTDRVHGAVEETAFTANAYGLVLQPVLAVGDINEDNVQCSRCTVSGNTIAGVVAGSAATCLYTAKLIVLDSALVGNSTAEYAQPCGQLYFSNVRATGNATVRKLDAGGSAITFQDNVTVANKMPGNTYSGVFGKD